MCLIGFLQGPACLINFFNVVFRRDEEYDYVKFIVTMDILMFSAIDYRETKTKLRIIFQIILLEFFFF